MTSTQQDRSHSAQGRAQRVPSRLQVGVVGLGRMGRHHAFNIIHRVPQAALLCACSPAEPDLVWADEFLKPHGVRVTPTFEEMIETPGLDAVIIASATFLHASQTVTALNRGLHVLCEKPVCKTVKEVSGPQPNVFSLSLYWEQ